MKLSDDVAIFWDYENCPVPNSSSGYAVANSITAMARPFGRVRLFRAYLEIADQLPLRSELQSSGVSLVDCPHNGRKDVADKMILVDMLTYAIDNPTPCTIIVISGDRDFAYALSMLKIRHFQMVLVTLPNAHVSLTSQATLRYDWTSTTRNAAIRPSVEHLRSASTPHINGRYNQWQTAHEVVAPSQYPTLQSAKPYPDPVTSINLSESDETPDITHLLRQHSQRQLSLNPRSDDRRAVGPEQRDPLSFANVTASQNVKRVNKYEGVQQPMFDAPAGAQSMSRPTFVVDPPVVEVVTSAASPLGAIESSSVNVSQQATTISQDEITTSIAPVDQDAETTNRGLGREGLPDLEEQSWSDEEIEASSRSRSGQGLWEAEQLEDDTDPSSPLSAINSTPLAADSGPNNLVLQTPSTSRASIKEDDDDDNDDDDDDDDDEASNAEVTASTIQDDEVDIELPQDDGYLAEQTSDQQLSISSPPQPLANLSDAALGGLASPFTQFQASEGLREVDGHLQGEIIKSETSTTESSLAFPDSPEIPFKFDILETVLKQLKDGGILRPLRSTVAVLISAKGNTHENAALEDVERYLEWALGEELISSGGEGDKAWVSLQLEVNNKVSGIEGSSEANVGAVLPPTDTERQTSAFWSNPPMIPFDMPSSTIVEPLRSMPSYPTMLGMPAAAPPFSSQQWNAPGSKESGMAIVNNVGGSLLLMPSNMYSPSTRTAVYQPQPSSKPNLKTVEVKVFPKPSANASTSSSKQSTSSTQRHIPPHFVILVQSLQANRNSGERRTLRTDIALQIANDGKTYERAGVNKFRSYLNLAIQEGIIEIGGNDADAWVRLRPEWYNAIPTPAASKKKIVPSEFVELVQALQAFKQEGIPKPLRSQVASQLSKGVYKRAGVSKWGQYADLALSEGIVKLGGNDGQDWISLHPKWHK